MPTVLIGPVTLRHRPGPYRDVLTAAGFTLIEPPGNARLSPAELRAALPEADAVLAGGESVTGDLIAAAGRLRVVARAGVGVDSVDVAAASARGIVVTITPGTNDESVAEQVFALLLALTRNVVGNDRDIRAGGWNRAIVQPLRDKTLGLVGLGRIGRATATRAVALGMRVLAHDPAADADFDARYGIERCPLDALLAESDVVSLHLPLTDATRGMFDRNAFARMRPGSYFVNTARGGLVVESDLAAALASGQLAGAGLDVLHEEPPAPDNPLLRAPNVVFSPHIGAVDARAMADMGELAARCVVALYRGQWPGECVVNAELADGWRW